MVGVFDAGVTSDDRPYIVMEHMTRSADDQMATNGPYPWVDAVDITLRVADALQAAHDRNILHRDVKPSNILISPQGVAKLSDFGIARILDEDGATRTGLVRGSVAYASPEQLEGRALDARTDVYSLAATFHHLVVGSAPFASEDSDSGVLALIRRILDEPLPPIDPSVLPTELMAVLTRAMAKDRSERPATCREFADELRREAQNASRRITPPPPASPDLGPPTDPPAPVGASASRQPDDGAEPHSKKRWLIIGGIGALAAIGIAVAMTVGAGGGDRPSTVSVGSIEEECGRFSRGELEDLDAEYRSATRGLRAASNSSGLSDAARAVTRSAPPVLELFRRIALADEATTNSADGSQLTATALGLIDDIDAALDGNADGSEIETLVGDYRSALDDLSDWTRSEQWSRFESIDTCRVATDMILSFGGFAA